MKDNFDLKKFLTENKTIEKSNPYLKEEMSDSVKEDKDIKSALREKIREMVIDELEDTSLEEAKKDEEETPKEDVEAEEEVETEEDVDITDEETPEEEGGMDVPEMEGDEGEILNHLMKALGMAKSAGDEKLIKQIGNTVTFLTRQYISGE